MTTQTAELTPEYVSALNHYECSNQFGCEVYRFYTSHPSWRFTVSVGTDCVNASVGERYGSEFDLGPVETLDELNAMFSMFRVRH